MHRRNDYGLDLGTVTITGTERWPSSCGRPGQWRYYITPTDTPWFPVAEVNLTAIGEAVPAC